MSEMLAFAEAFRQQKYAYLNSNTLKDRLMICKVFLFNLVK